MARTLKVQIIGDAASLSRAFGTAGVEAESFGSKLGGLAKMAALALGAGAVGGIALVLDKSVKAAMGAQTSQTLLNTALKNTRISTVAASSALDKATASARKLGFANNDTRTALAKLITATGSTKKAISDLSTAQDIARFKNTSLTNATQMLAMAQTGSQRAAKQLGITVPPVTAAYDALKASGEKLTTQQGILAEAHAKMLDKMATGNAVIDAVNEKLHGQAQAYADTAAGGMAQFQAQLENLEEGLGNKLLPALVSVMNWVNDHWPQISNVFSTVFNAVGVAIDYVKPYLADFVAGVSYIVDRVRADWPQISAVIDRVMSTVKAIITDTVAVLKAIWARFGDTITQIATIAFHAVETVVQDLASIIGSVFTLIGDLVHGRWGKIWGDLSSIVSKAWDAVETILQAEATIAWKAAVAIGSAIVSGVLSGLSDLYKKTKDAIVGGLTSAWHGAGSLLHGSGEFQFTKYAGANMAQGIIDGWNSGMVPFTGIVSSKLTAVFKAAAAQIDEGIFKLAKQTTLLQDATAYASQASTAAANAQTISDYQAAILSTTGAATGTAVGAYNSAGALGRAGVGTGGAGVVVTVPITVNGTADAAFAKTLADQLATQLKGGRVPALTAALQAV